MNSLPESDSYLDVNSRKRILTFVLIAVTAIILFICYGILQPFLSVFSWSLALAVISYPIYRSIRSRVKQENLAAGLAVCILAFCIVTPMIFVGREIFREATENIGLITQHLNAESWESLMPTDAKGKRAVRWLEKTLNIREAVTSVAERISSWVPQLFTGSVWSLLQLLLVLFTSFFLYRDHALVVLAIRELIPLSESETTEVFGRIEDTIHATLYGTLVVAAIQGTLGGLMFWWLGLPAPVLWGIIMAFLALIPYLGAFVIWVPAAIYFAGQGDWASAILLSIWGGIVVALIDNILYPVLVGKKLRLHTLPLFFFILGGVAFFGASGLVLGPLTLAVADALLEIWRRRLQRQPQTT